MESGSDIIRIIQMTTSSHYLWYLYKPPGQFQGAAIPRKRWQEQEEFGGVGAPSTRAEMELTSNLPLAPKKSSSLLIHVLGRMHELNTNITVT